MLIEIDVAVADDGAFHNRLDRILHKIDDGWHLWDTSGVESASAFENSSWLRDRGLQREWVHELLVASLQRDAWSSAPHGRRLRVTKNPRENDELTPEDAVRLVEEPLVLFVENRNSDGAFAERVATECDRALRRLWRRPGRPIRLDSVGGIGEMPAEVERRARMARFRPRLVVIVDGDRKFPDAEEPREVRAVRKACEANGVACWILAKRESENYLPRALLDGRLNAGMDHALRVDAWDDLTDTQKDFYDMKEGLPDRPSEGEAALFEDLTAGNRDVLSSGFGRNVANCWSLHVPVERQLLDRGGGDLERGISVIRGEV